jgi:hypothetical protein
LKELGPVEGVEQCETAENLFADLLARAEMEQEYDFVPSAIMMGSVGSYAESIFKPDEDISEADEPFESNFKVDVQDKQIKNSRRKIKIVKKTSLTVRGTGGK